MRKISNYFISLLITVNLLAGYPFAQQLRTELGQDKAQAVEAMLIELFPNASPVWAADLYVQSAGGSPVRIALTNVIKVSSGDAPEFVAGLQEYDEISRVLSTLRTGKPVLSEHSHAHLAAAAKTASGSFQSTASVVLEPNRLFSNIISIGVDPTNGSQLLLSYKTVDIDSSGIVEVVWYAFLDSSLRTLQKRPAGLEIRHPGETDAYRVLYVKQRPTGITISDFQTEQHVDIPCTAICEPTISQMLATN